MTRFTTLVLAAGLFAAAEAPRADTRSPYSGQEGRGIKALSEDEIEGYRQGHGVGLARPAELNHYPGPRHVLDLAQELSLTPEQVRSAQAIYDRMHAEATRLGAGYVEAETKLEAFFARGETDEAALSSLVEDAARLQGQLRLAHLRAHVALRGVLTPEHVARYDALRGYQTVPGR